MPLTTEDRDELLAVCAHWNWIGLRDRAIVWVLWTTGVRAGEVCSLDGADVDWVNEVIRVRSGKAGVRYEPILEYECATAIRQYQLQRPHDADNLFVDIHGGPFTRHALEQLCRRLAKRAGWPADKPSFPHAWRHSARNRMRDLGLDDTDVSALLGHKSVVATRGYARRAAANLAKARLRLAIAARKTATG